MAHIYSKTHPGKFGLWIDWETTGADFGTGESAKRYQGISFGAIITDLETFEEVDSLYREILFNEAKYAWTDRAAEIHGLTREYLAANGVSQEEALTDLLEMMSKYGLGSNNSKVMIGGHNVSFDIDFTNQLTLDVADFKFDWHHVRLETSALGFTATGVYKSNQLFPLFGAEVRGKHNALDDARQSLAVARAIRSVFDEVLK
jgi:DNA polymerase III epsilon subunit-like protein